MRSYRLLLLDKRGRVVRNLCVDCIDDREALAVAARKIRTCEFIEIWNGGRPVGIFGKPPAPPSRLATLFRKWRHDGIDQSSAADAKCPG